MTRKQMKKLAQEIFEQELIHQSESSSMEDKSRAEKKIMELTNKICSSKDGMQTMLEIDILIQELANKNNNL